LVIVFLEEAQQGVSQNDRTPELIKKKLQGAGLFFGVNSIRAVLLKMIDCLARCQAGRGYPQFLQQLVRPERPVSRKAHAGLLLIPVGIRTVPDAVAYA
jgi:hypothetical protein